MIWLSFLLSLNVYTKTVIHAGFLIDGSNDNPMNEMSIYVIDNKITEVITGYVQPDPDDEYIDLSGYTVLPGLIDMHVHLTSNQSSPKRYLESTRLNPADYAIRSVNNAKMTLLAGFTTVRNLGDSDAVTVSLRNEISNGTVLGPRIFTAGKSIASTDGRPAVEERRRGAVFVGRGDGALVPGFSEDEHAGRDHAGLRRLPRAALSRRRGPRRKIYGERRALRALG